jgi:Uncharacterised nucleotidyltransferase
MPDPMLTLPKTMSKELASLLLGQLTGNKASQINWTKFIIQLEENGMAGSFYDSMKKFDFDISIPPEIYLSLECSYRRNQVSNIILREELRSALNLLNEAGIQAIVLKGAALSELVYGDIGLRPMSDVDLLVRRTDAEHAEALFINEGYRRAVIPEVRPGFDRLFRVDTPLQAKPPSNCVIEIHWYLSGPLFVSRYVDHTAIWQRAVPVSIVGQPAYTLDPEDWVLHLTAHAFFTHRSIRLQNILDLDRLIRYLGSGLDWGKLIEIGRAFHWLPAVAALLPPCIELLDTPIPQEVIQEAKSYRISRMEHRLLAWWLTPGRPNRQHVFPDWAILPGIMPRLRVIWSFLFPGREFMEAQYPKRSTWKAPLVHLQRWWNEIASLWTSPY